MGKSRNLQTNDQKWRGLLVSDDSIREEYIHDDIVWIEIYTEHEE